MRSLGGGRGLLGPVGGTCPTPPYLLVTSFSGSLKFCPPFSVSVSLVCVTRALRVPLRSSDLGQMAGSKCLYLLRHLINL